MLAIFKDSVVCDLRSMLKLPSEWFSPIIFFSILITLFGLALGQNNTLLRAVTPAVIWIGFFITQLLTIESLLKREEEEGSLEQLILSPYPLWWLLLAKSLSIWIVASLPLVLLTPLLSILMQLSFSSACMLFLSLLVGSPALTLMAVLGAILTLTLPRAGIYLGLILLPLYIPLLILGESAGTNLLNAQWPLFQVSLLGALSILSLSLIPHAMAGALKAGRD